MGSDSVSEDSPDRRFRTLFISDVHLGARGSQADRLLDFLRIHDADTIYLVGDIVDGWALRSSWYWPRMTAWETWSAYPIHALPAGNSGVTWSTFCW